MNISLGAGIAIAAGCALIGFLSYTNVNVETIKYIAGGLCTLAVLAVLFT